MISDKALREFKRIWREEKNEDLSDELAMEEATQLLTIFDVIYKPIKKVWVEELTEKSPNDYEHRYRKNSN